MKIIRWLNKNIVLSKTLPFIWGLIFSQSLAKFGVVNVLMDYLTGILDLNMRKAAIVVNLQDGLSSIFVIVTHVLESHTGRFNVILLCTASYVTGLLLFWTSEDTGMFCGAVTLIALGRASRPSAFLRYQLKEKVKQSTGNSREVNSADQNKERRETSSEHQNGEVSKESREINSEDQDSGQNKENKEVSSEDPDSGINKENKETSSEHQNGEDSKESREINSEDPDSGRNKENKDIGSEYQNPEDNKYRREINSENGEQNKEKKRINRSNCIWSWSATISGALIASFLLPADNETQWKKTFKVAALLMGATYLLFYSGCFCYSFEEPCGSPLYKIYRVFIAALRKSNLKYPDSEGGYYWKNHKENFYFERNGKIRLEPEVPKLWRWLDKAAINRVEFEFYFSPEEEEKQEKNGKICTVQEVREVKRFCSLMHMSFTFWSFSLVEASANTFFVEQAGTLKPDLDVNFLFIISSITSSAVNTLFNSKKLRKHKQGITIVRIGAGMVCAVLCCFTAGLVELHRLSLTRKEGIAGSRDRKVSMSMQVLIPQFLLSGLMDGLAKEGLENFYSNYVPESMKGLVDPFTEFVIGTGKLLTVPCILIFSAWFKDSINTSHLERYFLMLGILNIAALCFFVYYSLTYAYKKPYPEDEELGNVDEQGQGEVD